MYVHDAYLNKGVFTITCDSVSSSLELSEPNYPSCLNRKMHNVRLCQNKNFHYKLETKISKCSPGIYKKAHFSSRFIQVHQQIRLNENSGNNSQIT